MEALRAKIEPMLDRLESLDAVIAFDCGADGALVIDASDSPVKLVTADDDPDVDCTIKISGKNLDKLLDGKLDPMLAFTLGKLKVKGSMGVAMKLSSLLD